MPNDRLRDALLRNGLTPTQVATAIGVDPKTVERWITKSRTPYQRHRHAIAAMVRETENYLWPDAVAPERISEVAQSEVIQVYPHRYSVPGDLWTRLFDQAAEQIEILLYSGMFLTDNPALIKLMRKKAQAGTKIRILVGDPASKEVAKRSTDEGLDKTTLPAKARNALVFYKPLDGVPGIEIRTHSTILYNSIYRFDEDMLVNTHVYGFGAAQAPVLHLRRLSAGDLFETYSESYENVWSAAKPPKW
jgi:transcriptional regulator with XRE-family HTH domain